MCLILLHPRRSRIIGCGRLSSGAVARRAGLWMGTGRRTAVVLKSHMRDFKTWPLAVLAPCCDPLLVLAVLDPLLCFTNAGSFSPIA